MENLAKKNYSEEEYLELERKSEFKNEYYKGEIFAMSGAKRAHNVIAINILSKIHSQFISRPCNVYGSDMRVLVKANGLYTYPDISAVCEEEIFLDENKDTLLNPGIIVEVLSESTEKYDRGEKFELYRELRSLKEYILVSTKRKKIELYKKNQNGRWELSESKSGENIKIESIDCILDLEELYAKSDIVNS